MSVAGFMLAGHNAHFVSPCGKILHVD